LRVKTRAHFHLREPVHYKAVLWVRSTAQRNTRSTVHKLTLCLDAHRK
jgi:hypothetical protein